MAAFSDTTTRLTLGGLQKAIDTYLGSDPDAEAMLMALGNITVAIEFADIGQTLLLHCRDGSLTVGVPTHDQSDQASDREAAVDARITAPLKDFIALALRRDEGRRFSELTISGHVIAAQKLWNTIAAIDFNWESFLAPFIGDVVAHELGRGMRAGGLFLQSSLNSLAETTTEYTQEEVQLTPSAGLVKNFVEQVDVLRDDVERLQARINRLLALRRGGPS